MQETGIYLTFHHLSVLFVIMVLYGACVAVFTSAVVRSLQITKPFTRKQKLLLQWAPAIASAILWGLAGPFVYGAVVTSVEGWEWNAIAAPVGFMGGLLSKPAYYLLKRKIGPAWVAGSANGLKAGDE